MFNYSSFSNSEIICGSPVISDETTYIQMCATLAHYLFNIVGQDEAGSIFSQKESVPHGQFQDKLTKTL